ncbi:MAG: rubrerythrin family protein [Haloarculaceae archaeon]
MNGQMFVEEVREAKTTELNRLGSEKALLAATRADLSAEATLETVALALDGLRTAFAEWADETASETAREVFGDAVDSLEDEYDRVVAELDVDPAGEASAPIPTVRSFDRPEARVAAGLVGHGLVFNGTLLQAVSFFINEADPRRADLCRDLRSGANSRIDDGATALDDLCTVEDDWNRAEGAAIDVVEAAYRDYTGTLGDMGIDPKPVC